LVRQAPTIGHDNLAGRLTGGIELVGTDAINRPGLDVRQANEFTAGHVPDAVHVELGALPNAPVPEGPVATMCGKTERAMTDASVPERRGRRGVAVLRGGYTAWSAHHETKPAR
jgi:hydroxyacylglutathione hydrolase